MQNELQLYDTLKKSLIKKFQKLYVTAGIRHSSRNKIYSKIYCKDWIYEFQYLHIWMKKTIKIKNFEKGIINNLTNAYHIQFFLQYDF